MVFLCMLLSCPLPLPAKTRVGFNDLRTVQIVMDAIQKGMPKSTVPAVEPVYSYTIAPVAPMWYTERFDSAEIIGGQRNQPVTGILEENFVSEINLILNTLDVLVVDDSSNIDCRLFSMTSLLAADVTGLPILAKATRVDLNVLAQFYLSAATFNEKVSAWEPLIDPIDIRGADRRDSMWGINAALSMSAEEPRHTDLEILAVQPLQLTVTKNAIDAIVNSAFFLQPEDSNTESNSTTPHHLNPIVLSDLQSNGEVTGAEEGAVAAVFGKPGDVSKSQTLVPLASEQDALASSILVNATGLSITLAMLNITDIEVCVDEKERERERERREG